MDLLLSDQGYFAQYNSQEDNGDLKLCYALTDKGMLVLMDRNFTQKLPNTQNKKESWSAF